jgi:GNAT superfamily N-acetyltransferase
VNRSSVSICQLADADFDAADGILKAAFGFPESSKPDLRRYVALQPDGWFLATRAGFPIGMVGAVDYGRFAYIGLMAVHPAEQSRGVGRALLQYLLAWLDARGTPIALLDATDAGRSLYASLGFVEEDRACIYALQELSSGAAGVPPLVRPLQPGDVPAIVDLDAHIFGAERGAVLREFIADYPGRFFVAHDEKGRLSGYLCAQSRRLGPWATPRREDAEKLLQAALTLPFTAGVNVLVPQVNRAASELLESFGFSMVRAIQHMRRGGTHCPGQRELLYGQASFAIG